MRPPGVDRKWGCLADACGLKQGVSQPRRVAALKVKGLPEDPSLVPATRVRCVQAIVLDLADIKDSLIAVRQTRRHPGQSDLAFGAFCEYTNG